MQNLTLEQIEKAIEQSKPDEQRQLLSRLPHLLGMSAEGLGWLKTTEASFKFWDNEEDAVYDEI